MMRERLDKLAVLFSIAMFLIYLSTLSVSLDDEDSVHFALGLTDFNVTKYQPHPPGFSVYMAAGMFFNTFFRDEVLSLTFMSALFGALSLLALYLLAREMFRREIALAASVLTAITPLFWLNSVKAMSDMTGLFFVLASLLFLYRHVKYGKPRDLYLGALLSGISLGVRIHSLFILLPVLVYSGFLHKRDYRTWLRVAALFIAATLVWFLPLLAVTGISEYFSVSWSQLFYRVDMPGISVLGTGMESDYLGQRLLGFPYFFLFGGYGINLAGLGILSAMLLLLMAVLIIIFLGRISLRDRRFRFLLTGIVPYLIAVFIMLPPFNPRYLLILVPVLSMVFAGVLLNLKRAYLRYALFGLLVVLISVHSVFLALQISSIPSPPVQLVSYVNENYDSDDVIILSGFAEKYFAYYHTDLTTLSGTGTDCSAIRSLLSGGRSVLAVSGIGECEGLKLIEVARFSRDPRVHVKRSMIILYEFSF